MHYCGNDWKTPQSTTSTAQHLQHHPPEEGRSQIFQINNTRLHRHHTQIREERAAEEQHKNGPVLHARKAEQQQRVGDPEHRYRHDGKHNFVGQNHVTCC